MLVYRVDGTLDANIPLSVVGSAVYNDLALMNHFCAANTTRFYQDGRAVLVAKRDIKELWIMLELLLSIRVPHF